MLGVQLPRTLKELQAVMGKLNFAAKFCPQYNKLSRPLKQLMSHQGESTWTEQHTACLNGLLHMAAAKLHLAVADWGEEVELAVDLEEGDTVGGVVLSQGAGRHKKIVALVGRDMTPGECSWTFPE